MRFNRMSILTSWIALAVSIGASVTDSASATAIQGTTTVIDCDTIDIQRQRIRLDAVDAPEGSHLCLDAVRNRIRCDQKLALMIDNLIRGSHMAYGQTPKIPNSDAPDPVFDHAPNRQINYLTMKISGARFFLGML
jgi:hypothetical protein